MQQETNTGNTEAQVANGPVADAQTAQELRAAQKAHNRKMLIGMIILCAVAIAGVVYGVITDITKNDEISKKDSEISQLQVEVASANGTKTELMTDTITITSPDDTVIEVMEKPDMTMVRNLVEPYLDQFTYLNDIFDHDFDESTKFFVAFSNLNDAYNIYHPNSPEHQDTVRYNIINDAYQYLFGSDEAVAKQDYGDNGHLAYIHFTYEDDNYTNGNFMLTRYGGGGTGAGLFSVVKDAYYENDSLVVEMYHATTAMCAVREDGGACLDAEGMSAAYNDTNDAVEKFISQYPDEVSTYKMIFVPDAGHYVLDDIVKVS